MKTNQTPKPWNLISVIVGWSTQYLARETRSWGLCTEQNIPRAFLILGPGYYWGGCLLNQAHMVSGSLLLAKQCAWHRNLCQSWEPLDLEPRLCTFAIATILSTRIAFTESCLATQGTAKLMFFPTLGSLSSGFLFRGTQSTWVISVDFGFPTGLEEIMKSSSVYFWPFCNFSWDKGAQNTSSSSTDFLACT